MNEVQEISDRLVWIDVETTGIHEDCELLEIAIVITDNSLVEIDCFSSLVIRHNALASNFIRIGEPKNSKSEIKCWANHFDSGLVDDLIREESNSKHEWSRCFSHDVHSEAVKFLNKNITTNDARPRPPMCGASVHFDRKILTREMPGIVNLLHYRNIDVSTIRECARRWAPDLEIPESPGGHRAEQDICDSIELMKFFRKSIFLK